MIEKSYRESKWGLDYPSAPLLHHSRKFEITESYPRTSQPDFSICTTSAASGPFNLRVGYCL